MNLISKFDTSHAKDFVISNQNTSEGKGDFDNSGNVIFGRQIISSDLLVVPKTIKGYSILILEHQIKKE